MRTGDLPDEGFKFFAVPVKFFKTLRDLPVRAFGIVPGIKVN